jgi:hypothetical protein
MNLLSSRAIQAKPYFSRLREASGRVFNKVIHSLLGLLLKILKNNNLPTISRIFMSKKMTECMNDFKLKLQHKGLDAHVA